MFEIGEKVLCVNNKPWKSDWDPPNNLDEGVVYTVRGFDMWPLDGERIQIVYLEETQNMGFLYRFDEDNLKFTDEYGDTGYVAARFRKLIKKKQSIEIFNQIRKNVEDNAHIYSVIPHDELEKYLS